MTTKPCARCGDTFQAPQVNSLRCYDCRETLHRAACRRRAAARRRAEALESVAGMSKAVGA